MGDNLFQRSKYSDRLRLTAADLENQQEYDGGKRRLLNHALFGSGVVCGLTARVDPLRQGVAVARGLAFDASGRELLLPRERFISAAQLFPEPPEGTEGWYLCLRYRERECGEGYLLQPDGTHRQTANRVQEDVQILALRRPGEEELCIARLRLSPDGGHTVCVRGVEPLAAPILFRGQTRVASGIFWAFYEAWGPGGQVLYSDEISHGLGPGNVLVTVVAEARAGERRCLISGKAGLFGSDLQTAVKLYPDSGTFVTAVRSRETLPGRVALRWYAQRAENAPPPKAEPFPPLGMEPPVPPKAEPPMPPSVGPYSPPGMKPPMPPRLEPPTPSRLEPHVALLFPGETERFVVCGSGGAPYEAHPRFSVGGGEGFVDGGGLYTAPQTAGTYRLEATLAENPGETLTAWIIVLERV